MSDTLYHGSRFKQKELMPGFKRTGVEVKWDKTESNHFLYATSVKATAASLGFASAIEKMFELDEYHTDGNKITIVCKKDLTEHDLQRVIVYLYTINNLPEDEWVKNDNEHNKLDTEYKTTKTITDGIETVEQLDTKEWLKDKEITFKKSEVAEESHKDQKKPAYSRW